MENVMNDYSSSNQFSPLSGIAGRYPEKTFYLGQVFNDTTNSYKLLWLLAILSLLRRTQARTIALADIFAEMAVVAWHPVCLYRLSLGRQDKLQDVIRELQLLSKLPANAASDAIRQFLVNSDKAKLHLQHFKQYVPTRFLSPWFADKLRGEKDCSRNSLIIDLALQSQRTAQACPYWFRNGFIEINESWRAFFVENMAVVQAFTEFHLSVYLQTRNPNVPGVMNKLRAPVKRQLTTARRFWRHVREQYEKRGQAHSFRDIYTEQALDSHFAIDHFLPWSFTAHDLLWNLAPVDPTTNSKKGDAVPDLNIYVPRLARLHFGAIEITKKQPRLLEDYINCFKMDADDLLSLGENGFVAKYREVLVPQAQIALNQGFQSEWQYRN
jgi:hypothetical protein